MRHSLALSHVPSPSVQGSRVRRGPERRAVSRIVSASAPSFDGEGGATRSDAAVGGSIPEKQAAVGNGASTQYCFSILRKNRSGSGNYMPKQYGSPTSPNGSAKDGAGGEGNGHLPTSGGLVDENVLAAIAAERSEMVTISGQLMALEAEVQSLTSKLSTLDRASADDMSSKLASVNGTVEDLASKVSMHWRHGSGHAAGLEETQRLFVKEVRDSEKRQDEEIAKLAEQLNNTISDLRSNANRVAGMSSVVDTIKSKVDMHWRWGSSATARIEEAQRDFTKEIRRGLKDEQKARVEDVARIEAEAAASTADLRNTMGKVQSMSTQVETIDSKVTMHWRYGSKVTSDLTQGLKEVRQGLKDDRKERSETVSELAAQVNAYAEELQNNASRVAKMSGMVENIQSKVDMHWRFGSKDTMRLAEDVKSIQQGLAREIKDRADLTAQLAAEVKATNTDLAAAGEQVKGMATKLEVVDSKVSMHWKHGSNATSELAADVQAVKAGLKGESKARAEADAQLAADVDAANAEVLAAADSKVQGLDSKVQDVASKVSMHWKHGSNATSELAADVQAVKAGLKGESKARAEADAQLAADVDAANAEVLAAADSKVQGLDSKVQDVASKVSMHWKHGSNATSELAADVQAVKAGLKGESKARAEADAQLAADVDAANAEVLAAADSKVQGLDSKVQDVASKVSMHWKHGSNATSELAADVQAVKAGLKGESKARAEADAQLAADVDAANAEVLAAADSKVQGLDSKVQDVASKVSMHWKHGSNATSELAADVQAVKAGLKGESKARAEADAQLAADVDAANAEVLAAADSKVQGLDSKVQDVASKVSMHWKHGSNATSELAADVQAVKAGLKGESKARAEADAQLAADVDAANAEVLAAADSKVQGLDSKVQDVASKVSMHWKHGSNATSELAADVQAVKAGLKGESKARAEADAQLAADVDAANAEVLAAADSKVQGLDSKVQDVASKVSMHWKHGSNATSELAADVQAVKAGLKGESKARAEADAQLAADVDAANAEVLAAADSKVQGLDSKVQDVASKVSMHWKHGSNATSELAADVQAVKAGLKGESKARAEADAQLAADVDAANAEVLAAADSKVQGLDSKVQDVASKVSMHWKHGSNATSELAADVQAVKAGLKGESKARAEADAQLAADVDAANAEVLAAADSKVQGLDSKVQDVASKVSMHWKHGSSAQVEMQEDLKELRDALKEVKKARAEGDSDLTAQVQAYADDLERNASRVASMATSLDTIKSKVDMHWRWGSKATSRLEEGQRELTKEVRGGLKGLARADDVSQLAGMVQETVDALYSNANRIAHLASTVDMVDSKQKMHWKYLCNDSAAMNSKIADAIDTFKAADNRQAENLKLSIQEALEVADKNRDEKEFARLSKLSTVIEALETKVNLHWRFICSEVKKLEVDQKTLDGALATIRDAAHDAERRQGDAEAAAAALGGDVDHLRDTVGTVAAFGSALESKVNISLRHWSKEVDRLADVSRGLAARNDALDVDGRRDLEKMQGEVLGLVADVTKAAEEAAHAKAALTTRLEVVESKVKMHWRANAKGFEEVLKSVGSANNEISAIAHENSAARKDIDAVEASVLEARDVMDAMEDSVAALAGSVEVVGSKVRMHWASTSLKTEDVIASHHGLSKSFAEESVTAAAKLAATREDLQAELKSLSGVIASLERSMGQAEGTISVLDSKVQMHWKYGSMGIQKVEEEIRKAAAVNAEHISAAESRVESLEAVTSALEEFSLQGEESRRQLATALDTVRSAGDIRWKHLGGEVARLGAAQHSLQQQFEHLEGAPGNTATAVKGDDDLVLEVMRDVEVLEGALARAEDATRASNEAIAVVRDSLMAHVEHTDSRFAAIGSLSTSDTGLDAARDALSAIRRNAANAGMSGVGGVESREALRASISAARNTLEQALGQVADQMGQLEGDVLDQAEDSLGNNRDRSTGFHW